MSIAVSCCRTGLLAVSLLLAAGAAADQIPPPEDPVKANLPEFLAVRRFTRWARATTRRSRRQHGVRRGGLEGATLARFAPGTGRALGARRVRETRPQEARRQGTLRRQHLRQGNEERHCRDSVRRAAVPCRGPHAQGKRQQERPLSQDGPQRTELSHAETGEGWRFSRRDVCSGACHVRTHGGLRHDVRSGAEKAGPGRREFHHRRSGPHERRLAYKPHRGAISRSRAGT